MPVVQQYTIARREQGAPPPYSHINRSDGKRNNNNNNNNKINNNINNKIIGCGLPGPTAMYTGKHVCRYLYIAECLPSLLRKSHITAQQFKRDRHTKTLKAHEYVRTYVFVGESHYCMIIVHVLGLSCS